MARHLIITAIAGLTAMLLAIVEQQVSPGHDLGLPLRMADNMLRGVDAYHAGGITMYRGLPAATYPLTTLMFLAPFTRLGFLAPYAMWGIGNAALVFAMLRTGQPRWRYALFASGVYVYTLQFFQFSPFIAAAYLLPAFLPFVLLKPQIGLPVFLARFTWRGAAICAALGLLSLAVYPTWPLRWLETAQNYDGFVPALTLPGLLLWPLLLRWRNPAARFVLLMALVPIRAGYDLLPLFLVPESRRSMFVMVALSWPAFILERWTGVPPQPWIVIGLVYLPFALMHLRPVHITPLPRQRTTSPPHAAA